MSILSAIVLACAVGVAGVIAYLVQSLRLAAARRDLALAGRTLDAAVAERDLASAAHAAAADSLRRRDLVIRDLEVANASLLAQMEAHASRDPRLAGDLLRRELAASEAADPRRDQLPPGRAPAGPAGGDGGAAGEPVGGGSRRGS